MDINQELDKYEIRPSETKHLIKTKVYFDGAYEDGIATWGFWIEQDGELLEEASGHVPSTFKQTSNTAEFYAMTEALEAVRNHNPERVIIYGDSQLALCCVSGRWKTKAEHLIPIRDRARMMIDLLDCPVRFWWIRGIDNEHADALSRFMEQANLRKEVTM